MDIKIGAWNIRGTNKVAKRSALAKFISTEKLSYLGILETRSNERKAKKAWKQIKGNWEWLSNFDLEGGGRMWVGYDQQIFNFLNTTAHKQVIHSQLEDKKNKTVFWVSLIYASNDSRERRKLWAHLKDFKLSMGEISWIILGDFNVVRSCQEKEGGNDTCGTEVDDFNDCIHTIGVEDLRSSGNF